MPMRFTVILFAFLAPLLVQAKTSPVVRHANNFEIDDYGSHKILTVRNTFRDSEQTYHYALVPRAAALPELPKDIPVIRTPVQRVVTMETVYIGHLDAIGELDRIIGAATVDFISNPDITKRVASGAIEPVQIGQALDVEKLLLLQPDLILTSISGDASFDVPPKLQRTGLPIVLSAGYMEKTPLARAEWLKFVAAFFERDSEADERFNAIERRYQTLARIARNAAEKPTVLCGAPYSGIWHVPGGQSYTAQAIRDAGGHYLWSEDPSQGGIPLDTERVFLKAAHADFWINPSRYRTMTELLSADGRFSKFAAAQEQMVYNNTRQVSENGGNAIWESGVVRPDDLLADLIYMFHPELLPKHEFVYYERLR